MFAVGAGADQVEVERLAKGFADFAGGGLGAGRCRVHEVRPCSRVVAPNLYGLFHNVGKCFPLSNCNVPGCCFLEDSST